MLPAYLQNFNRKTEFGIQLLGLETTTEKWLK